MKDKIFLNLVENKNFDNIVFKFTSGDALKVDDIVLNDLGDFNGVIDQTVYWVYDTQEVRDLARWIHTKNQVLNDNKKIHFSGFDVMFHFYETQANELR